MNIQVWIHGEDVTDSIKLDETRINYDSSRRVTTASITLMGNTPTAGPVGSAIALVNGKRHLGDLFRPEVHPARTGAAVYDDAQYDVDRYEVAASVLFSVTIFDLTDDSKLFEGQIFAIELRQTDAEYPQALYVCDLSDYSVWLDRAVCWDASLVLPSPATDQIILQTLIGTFAPQIDATEHVAQLMDGIVTFEFVGKTCRQVLDEMAQLTLATWFVDFDGKLWYQTAADAPAAPWGLSTSPDLVSTFPVRVDSWRRDFTNPVNKAFVRGQIDVLTGLPVQAEFTDLVSIEKYGQFEYSVVDQQIATQYDALLRAKSTVLKYAQPLEQGSFTIWKDGLKSGQRVAIHEDQLGIDGEFEIISLALAWRDKSLVEYRANFGAAKPDLESYLRLIDQRSRWQTAHTPAGRPIDGSVKDSSIAAGGLSAAVIGSVNADVIVGTIDAGQIGTVNASQIVGQLNAGQIGGVNATVIEGAIVADQIGSVHAATINGVIISDQLANGIVDDLAKYADALRPVPIVTTLPTGLPSDNYPPHSFFYYETDGHFYQMDAAGTGWTQNDSPQNSLMKFYSIGRISANSITGAIIAAQIGSVNASAITGLIQSSQIGSIAATSISGLIQANQIQSITASQISTAIQGSQIQNINGGTIIISTVQDTAIANVSGGKILAGTVTSDKLNASNIDVGGGGNKTARINVVDASVALVAQIGALNSGDYGGWFKVFGAGGTGYTDAKIKSDISGNLSITDAALSINAGGNGRIRTSPTTYGTSYSSIALIVELSLERTEVISRGCVVFYNNQQVGALARHASVPNAGTLTLYNGPATVVLDGSTGTVQANGAFNCNGAAGQSQSIGSFPDGRTMTFSGGILTGYNGPTFTPITKQMNIAKFGGGWYEAYFTNGLLAGVIDH